MTFHVDSEVGQLKQVIVHRPGPRARPAHPGQRRRPALRRRDVGRPGPGGARRLRRTSSSSRAWSCTTSPTCWPTRSTSPAPASSSQDHLTTATRFGPALDKPLDDLVASTPARHAGRPADRRRAQVRRGRPAARTEPADGLPARRRLPAAPAAEPPVPARQLRLGLRRPLDQPDGQAGAQAGDDQLPRGLQLPPDVPRRRDPVPLRQRLARRTSRPPSRAATSPSSATEP